MFVKENRAFQKKKIKGSNLDGNQRFYLVLFLPDVILQVESLALALVYAIKVGLANLPQLLCRREEREREREREERKRMGRERERERERERRKRNDIRVIWRRISHIYFKE